MEKNSGDTGNEKLDFWGMTENTLKDKLERLRLEKKAEETVLVTRCMEIKMN